MIVAWGLVVAAVGFLVAGVGVGIRSAIATGLGAGVVAGGLSSAWLAAGLTAALGRDRPSTRRSFGVSFVPRAALLGLGLVWIHRESSGVWPVLFVVAGYFVGQVPTWIRMIMWGREESDLHKREG